MAETCSHLALAQAYQRRGRRLIGFLQRASALPHWADCHLPATQPMLPLETAPVLCGNECLESSKVQIGALRNLGLDAITLGQSAYPPCLYDLEAPPSVLYVRGAFNTRGLCAGVVGPRSAPTPSLQITDHLVRILAARGFSILSGGAFGVDRVAHEAALRAGGTTGVVLASPINIPTPSSHTALFKRIVESGGWCISEYPPDHPTHPWQFVERNRIVAALSQVLIVVRPHSDSGSLITASVAQSLGRSVFVVGGDESNPNHRGVAALQGKGIPRLESAEDLRTVLTQEFIEGLQSGNSR